MLNCSHFRNILADFNYTPLQQILHLHYHKFLSNSPNFSNIALQTEIEKLADNMRDFQHRQFLILKLGIVNVQHYEGINNTVTWKQLLFILQIIRFLNLLLLNELYISLVFLLARAVLTGLQYFTNYNHLTVWLTHSPLLAVYKATLQLLPSTTDLE